MTQIWSGKRPMNCAGDDAVRSRVSALIVGAILALSLRVAGVSAAEYRPPVGFNGHEWDASLMSFRDLRVWRADAALGFTGKVTEFHCVADSSTGEACSTTYSRIEQNIEGEGSHALAEYYFNVDSNPWHADGIDLKAITYLFCAHAAGLYLPSPVKNSLRLCGARVMFHSDTQGALATQGPDHVSNYDRILARLVADYGDPDGYERRASITATSIDDASTSADKKRPPQDAYRWCGVTDKDKQLVPSCAATVTLAYEAATGEGIVLFATAAVYTFAYARHVTGDENNDLYVLLEGHPGGRKFRKVRVECTGYHICQPAKEPMSARQLHDYQP
jgi:hypothetical protein